MVYVFTFPDVGEGVSEGEIISWSVKEGDVVKEDQVLGEIETSKALVEIPSPRAGRIAKIHVHSGETVKVGQPLVTYAEIGEEVSSEASRAPASSVPSPSPVSASSTPSPVLPSTRKLAEQLHVDLEKVRGTGAQGRITDDDVRNRTVLAAPVDVVVPHPAPLTEDEKKKAPSLTFDSHGRVMRVPLQGIRRTIAERMTASALHVPHVTAMDEIDVTSLEQIREQEKAYAENKGIKLTLLSFVIKACVIALKEHPYVNASLDEAQQQILVKEYYNVGFAYDSPKGLVVPVLHHADNESVLTIAKKIQVLVEHVKANDIKMEDLSGSTFTITNYGSIGTMFGTPLINLPNAAILGMGRVVEKPLVVDGEVAIRKVLPLSLSYDHRIVDGAEAARFMNELKKHLEDPHLLLLDTF